MFWNKPQKQEEKELPIDRLTKLEAKTARLEAEILDLTIGFSTIRDKVLRKIRLNDRKQEINDEENIDLFAGIPKS